MNIKYRLVVPNTYSINLLGHSVKQIALYRSSLNRNTIIITFFHNVILKDYIDRFSIDLL